ncbi:MAG TPA: hypothetical protein VER79_10640 [Candidatus Limnocylindrales bacterium]|nr:hypothetical protein [Candidatus Limnocylindrales bacterium]
MLRSLLVLCLAALLSLPIAASAQTAPPDPLPESLNTQLENLVSITETIRGLNTIIPVERAFPTREETIAYLTELFSSDLPPEEAARVALFYQVLGLLPDDVDLAQAYLTLLGAQVAGFYDSDTQIMNVIPVLGDTPGSSLSITEQVIFVHEYTHALQDQHFGLDALNDPAVTAVPDRALALTALIEGDATAAMQVYAQELMRQNPLAALSLLAEGALSNTLTLPPGTPEVLARELLFPYEDGFDFVLAISRESGWDAVDAAYANPPTTTEQILHPEKYLAGEGAIEQPDWEIGPPWLGEGWVERWNVPLGEYYLREHLRTLMPATQASAAATGWGGDRFTVFESSEGARLWVLTSGWDTPEDEAEFLEAYREGLTNAYGPVLREDNRCHAMPVGVACVTRLPHGDTRVVVAPSVNEAQQFLPMD